MESASRLRRTLVASPAVAGLTAIVTTLADGMVVIPVGPPIDPAYGLAVPTALVLGLPGVIGVAAGVVLTAVLRSSPAWWIVADAGAVAVSGYLAYRCWGILPTVATGRDPRLGDRDQVVELLAVSLLATITAASALAWIRVLLQGLPFHSVVVTELPIFLVSTLLFALPVVPASRLLPETYRPSYADRTPMARGTGGFRGAVVVPVCWLLIATLASIAATTVQSIGEPALAGRGYGFVFAPFDPALVGTGGRRVQALFGALMFSLVIATWLSPNRNTQPDRSATTS